MLTLLVVIMVGYLVGSLPGGYIVGKIMGGVDVRKFGSGNIGTTNVLRVLGKGPALLVLLIDLGKAVAAVSLAGLLPTELSPSLVKAMGGLACIGGHNWPCFLRFRGGKGVATSAGVFLILTPLPFGVALITMLCVVGITRYVSLGSIISAATLPFYIWKLGGEEELIYVVLAMAVAGLIILRHWSNLKRLLAGKENKLGEKVRIG